MVAENDAGGGPPETEAGPSGQNKVGYCQPPMNHRFKPGRSGNPNGRRRLMGDFGRSLRLACDEPIRVAKGKRKTMPQIEVTLLQLLQRALRGDLKALHAFLKFGVKAGAIKPYELPDMRGGTLFMPMEFFYLSKEKKALEIEKEAARRNAMLARGLPYDRAHASSRVSAGRAG
jgi:hypothetical protein